MSPRSIGTTDRAGRDFKMRRADAGSWDPYSVKPDIPFYRASKALALHPLFSLWLVAREPGTPELCSSLRRADITYHAQGEGRKRAAKPAIRKKEQKVDDARRHLTQAETALAVEELSSLTSLLPHSCRICTALCFCTSNFAAVEFFYSGRGD